MRTGAATVGQSVATAAAPASVAAARPSNGKVLYDRISGGQGTLKVKNGTKYDAMITLVRGKTKAVSLYVRANSTASYKEVRDGTYRVYFTSGYRFSTSKKRFARSATYQRFDRSLAFRTTSTSSTIWTLTLNPVKNGNARTTRINPGDFPG
ncbi:hypothetical protein Misp01_61230 [Microtetraspora sp. NBRC 13810]|nr:hypothetical protein Misp01_61230 [Microtetraspora sp. NBRC 13810]